MGLFKKSTQQTKDEIKLAATHLREQADRLYNEMLTYRCNAEFLEGRKLCGMSSWEMNELTNYKEQAASCQAAWRRARKRLSAVERLGRMWWLPFRHTVLRGIGTQVA